YLSMEILKSSPVVGGVYVMALAPASIVAIIVSSVGPPVATIGTSGNSSLICLTMLAVFAAPETFRMVAPASNLDLISVFSDTTVTIMGISIILRIRSEEHTSELQSRENLVCRLLLEKKNRQGLLLRYNLITYY